MPFSTLFPTPLLAAALTDLQRKFGDARASLVRIRSDRVRLARTGWRPRIPAETKLIRSAEWNVERASETAPWVGVDFDLESRFVPTSSAFMALARSLDRACEEGTPVRFFLRDLELDEFRMTIGGRPICASFFDLALAASRVSDLVVVLPRVDGYLEARFWAEVGRTCEASLGLPLHSIRFEVSLDALGGVVEAEEILFELKDSVVGLLYDARVDRFDSLLMDSSAPALPREDFAQDPWQGIEIAARVENLQRLTRSRGVRLGLRPDGGPRTEITDLPTESPLTLDVLHAKASFAFRFLGAWFNGNPDFEGKDWMDFELARGFVWTAIRSGFLREENYEAWREEFGPAPFEAGSVAEAAVRVLDPLVRNAVFPESAKALAFAVLLDREKTRSVDLLRLA